jgi:hypothetical protein
LNRALAVGINLEDSIEFHCSHALLLLERIVTIE